MANFIDEVLQGWGAWAADDGVNSKPAAAYRVLRILVALEKNCGIALTEQAFLDLDRAIAHLPAELRRIADIEYRFTRGEGLSHEKKAAMIGMKRTAYRDRLAQIQRILLADLAEAGTDSQRRFGNSRS